MASIQQHSGGSFFPWHLIRADYFVKFVIPWRGRGFVIPWRNKLSNNVTSNNPRQWLVRQYHRQMAVSIESLSKCAISIFPVRHSLLVPHFCRESFKFVTPFENFFRIWIRLKSNFVFMFYLLTFKFGKYKWNIIRLLILNTENVAWRNVAYKCFKVTRSFFLSSSFSFYFHLWIVILHFSWESKEHFA